MRQKEEENMNRIRKTRRNFRAAAVLTAAAVSACGFWGTFPAAAAQTAVIEDTQVPLYNKPAGSYVRTPIASGVTVYKNDKATLDASNLSEGYVMVKYTGSVGKIKVQITRNGSETYTYDLNNSGVYEVFPLSEGNGSYQVKVFENIQGNQYSQAFSQNLDVAISNTFGPFLYPNQYVNFNAASAAVQKGAVCGGYGSAWRSIGCLQLCGQESDL